jgi:uncharacterized protein (DUF983 family)
MKWTKQLAKSYAQVSHAVASQPGVWRHCPHCEQTTPWFVNALRGVTRCMRCGNNPLAETEATAR